MSKAPNLKVNIGADTSDFEKGAKTTKQGLRDLEKVGGDALGKLGDAFGVNTGKLGQMASALQGLGAKLSSCGDAGTKAFGSILTSVAPVAAAIAGLGIGAATLAFKALNSEAENFKTTVQGANIEMATAAYVDTYRQVLHDFSAGTGQAVANAGSQWQKFWGEFSGTINSFFTSGTFLNPARGAQAWGAAVADASNKAERAEQIANQIYQLERQRSDNLVRIAQIDAQIAANRVIATDATESLEARAAAIASAEQLINEKYALRIPLETQIADLMEEANGLASSTPAQIDAANQQRILANNLAAQQSQELRTINRTSNTITKAAEAEAAARAKAAQQARESAEAAAKMRNTAITRQVEGVVNRSILTRLIDPDEAQVAELREHLTKSLEAAVPVNFVPDEAGLAQLAQAVQDAVQSYADAKGIDLSKASAPQVQPGKVEVPTELLKPRPEEVEEYRRVVEASLGSATFTVDVAVNADQIIDVTRQIESTVQALAESTGEVLGELAGNLVNGSGAWDTFKNSALSAFGDMAVSVGKMAISTGVATLGIKAALESLNGYAAIAAGVALVALGSAVKTGLSNVAGGNYSASMGTYTNESATASGDYEQRDIYVNVTGTLQADGDQLIAVINNSDKKKNLTT